MIEQFHTKIDRGKESLRMYSKLGFASALAFLLILAGCSKDSPVTPTTDTVGDVGGYTATDEAPAFGDPVLIAAAEGEVEYSDPVATTPPVLRGARGAMATPFVNRDGTAS
jgi:hypothetical protein